MRYFKVDKVSLFYQPISPENEKKLQADAFWCLQQFPPISILKIKYLWTPVQW